MTVDELVAEWTPAEREKHKDLIEECRKRERFNKDTQMEHARLLLKLSDEKMGQLAEAVLIIATPRQRGGRA